MYNKFYFLLLLTCPVIISAEMRKSWVKPNNFILSAKIREQRLNPVEDILNNNNQTEKYLNDINLHNADSSHKAANTKNSSEKIEGKKHTDTMENGLKLLVMGKPTKT